MSNEKKEENKKPSELAAKARSIASGETSQTILYGPRTENEPAAGGNGEFSN